MAKEIERKFLVNSSFDPSTADSSSHIIQGYLSVRPESTVRVRIIDDSAFITVKGRNNGAIRSEWEYQVPLNDAYGMLEECALRPVIEKTRYRVGRWEIDVFEGHLAPLVVAEIELADSNEKLELPDFIGREVTGDARYYNSVLSLTPDTPPCE